MTCSLDSRGVAWAAESIGYLNLKRHMMYSITVQMHIHNPTTIHIYDLPETRLFDN